MKIRVTDNDILKAERVRHLDRSENCPISQACKRQLFEWGEHIRTCRTEIMFRNGRVDHFIKLPPEATFFIDKFDRSFLETEPVLPFEFKIESEEIEKPVKIDLGEPTEHNLVKA